MFNIIAVMIILLIIIMKVFILKNATQKLKKYQMVSSAVGIVIIILMAILYSIDVQLTKKDSKDFKIINGTALSDVFYEGQKDDYYVIGQKGLFYFDYLFLPVDKVQLSDMCFNGSAVKLYCYKDLDIHYNVENRITLSDGTSGYYTDAVKMIKPYFIVLSISVICIDIALMFFNDVICLVVLLIKKRANKPDNKCLI